MVIYSASSRLVSENLNVVRPFIKTLCLAKKRGRYPGVLPGAAWQACCWYNFTVPRVWTTTLKSHRRAVRSAIMKTTAELAMKHGLTSLTMSQVAEKTGIGRATLYKYFADVEAILVAWHAEQVSAHVQQLSQVRDRGGTATERLAAVLEAFALISHQRHSSDLAAFVHRGQHVARAHKHVQSLIQDLLVEGAQAGEIRDDVAADELAAYCLHALSAASTLPSKTAVRRLVLVTMSGLRM
jgi:AcrR family transcriptional regulator